MRKALGCSLMLLVSFQLVNAFAQQKSAMRENRAHKLIEDQLTPAPVSDKGESGGTYLILFDAHSPFLIGFAQNSSGNS